MYCYCLVCGKEDDELWEPCETICNACFALLINTKRHVDWKILKKTFVNKGSSAFKEALKKHMANFFEDIYHTIHQIHYKIDEKFLEEKINKAKTKSDIAIANFLQSDLFWKDDDDHEQFYCSDTRQFIHR